MDVRAIGLLAMTLILLVPASGSASGVIQVPQQVGLQTAIDQALNGDVIEISPGTYPSPSGGFQINNKATSFTIRAVGTGAVVLDGQGVREVLRFQNTNPLLGGHVSFEGLTIRNGRSNIPGLTPGVTMQRAMGTFTDCRFEDNTNDEPGTVGAGVQVALGSTATFIRSVWSGNTAIFFGGGLAVADGSVVVIQDSQFLQNRVDLPNHSPTSSGGAIHVGNSQLTVDRTRFEGNRAGFAAGAIYAIGSWTDPAGSQITVRNSTFVDNKAFRDPSVSSSFPTEGGAFHAEDLTFATIHDSLFTGNEANAGAAVNLYRAEVEIHSSVFRGNRASGREATGDKSLGGAVSAISNDVSDPSTNFGATNRRAAQLTITDSFFQGRFGPVGTAADVGGCLFFAGDTNRAFGLGVPQQGSFADNRAVVSISDSILYDCDVQQHSVGGSGVGGGLAGDLVDLTLRDTMILDCDAFGLPVDNSSGGGIALLSHSYASIDGVTLARNTAGQFGAGVFAQGVDLEISNSSWVANEISPGVSETCFPSYGAGIFTAPFLGGGGRPARDATGFVESSMFTGNVGLPIFEDDRTDGPINDMRYDGNQIHSDFFAGSVYTSVINPPPAICATAATMNSHVVTRNNLTTSTKSLVDNVDLGAAPLECLLQASPPVVRTVNAEGDAPGPEPAFLGMVWSGGSATLNGNALAGNAASSEAAMGTHTLTVAATLQEAIFVPEPRAALLQALAFAVVLGLRRRSQER